MKYEDFVISNISELKKPTVYFFLKNNGFSENYIKNLRKTENSIKVNGQDANLRSIIRCKDLLQISKDFNFHTVAPACSGKLEIMFEDDDFLIVNKPHNLSCIPSRSHIDDNLGGRVLFYMQKTNPNFVLRIKNRLDKETAGIVIIAKNSIAYNQLDELKKEYVALCEGNFEEKEFTINSPILTVTHDGINQMKRVVSETGKSAVTHVKIIKDSNNLALAKFVLETGRTHQIRVHMSSINHALYGDTIYGTATDENHTFLLLKKIQFTHFRTKKMVEIEVPYPEDWSKYLN